MSASEIVKAILELDALHATVAIKVVLAFAIAIRYSNGMETLKVGDKVIWSANGMTKLAATVHREPAQSGAMAGKVALRVPSRPDMGTVWAPVAEVTKQ